MAADFSGYASRNDIVCSDGRTITDRAFQHQDGDRVPLVWMHKHNSLDNVLGHAELECRPDGVYAYGYFNNTANATTIKNQVKSGEINALSIFANNLVHGRFKDVLHGQITEVSLVHAGANPGAYIENINLAHGEDGSDAPLTEGVIYTGLELAHSDTGVEMSDQLTVQEIVATMDEDQKDALTYLVSEALDAAALAHADKELPEDATIGDIFDALTEQQKNVVYYMIGEALEAAAAEKGEGDAEKSAKDAKETAKELKHSFTEGFIMGQNQARNVFETNGSAGAKGNTLSHADLSSIFTEAQREGSFKDAILAHAATYGIEDIDILFPDAQTIANQPELLARRMEWVSHVLNTAKHSPLSRIKTTVADLTADEARAKGYVKGALKKDEIVKLLKRVTTPTTIYKKQKLDRDDIVDIKDLDVVAWLKGEMRIMLDEEIARAILVGDGREVDSDDKIDEDHVRPIATDADMFAHKVTLPSNTNAKAVIEAILRARTNYHGTGTPDLYTTDGVLTDLLLLEDRVGRRLYETEASLAAALRVRSIVPVEVMNDTPEILAIVVNLADYTIGADKGGQVSMFDDFDIDYNQHKYLIETRISGMLTKPKSALVIKREIGTSVTPASPSFNGETNTVTIPTVPGVVYEIDGVVATGSVVIEVATDVTARPGTGYSFPANTNRDWTFVPNGL